MRSDLLAPGRKFFTLHSSLFTSNTLHSSLRLGVLNSRIVPASTAACALFACLGERLDVGEAGLAGHQTGGVLALLRLVGEEAHHDRLELRGIEVLLLLGTLAAACQVEGAQSVELQLVALEEQLLEAVDELLDDALHDVGGVDGAVLLDVAADVVGAQGALADESCVGLAVGVRLLVLVLVRAVVDFWHNDLEN